MKHVNGSLGSAEIIKISQNHGKMSQIIYYDLRNDIGWHEGVKKYKHAYITFDYIIFKTIIRLQRQQV